MILVLIWFLTNWFSVDDYISIDVCNQTFFNKMLFGVVFFFILCSLTRADNFPSLLTTNATLAIVIDREYLADRYDSVKTAIENYIVYAKREILKRGGVNVQYYSWTSINVKRDITAILSVAPCMDTWRLFKAAESENLLHMAISESDCPRLSPDQAITVPLVTKGDEMPQILLDLRTAKSYNWNSVVILYDDTLGRDMVTRVITSLTRESSMMKVRAAAISLIKLNTDVSTFDMRQTIKDTLSTISTKTVGKNFLAIVSVELTEILMEYAKLLGLVNTKNQWLYVISDTNIKNSNITHLKRLLKEGDNVAFVYNTTTSVSSCVGGLICHAEELISAFCQGLDKAVQEEFDIASQVSDEEWEAIRPTKFERRNYLLRDIKNTLLHRGTCDNCTSWSLQAGETWGREYQSNLSDTSAELLYVGNWRASDGPTLKDELFPHIAHGFRRKSLPLVSYHNPPWQIIKSNDNGTTFEFSGLVFDVIKELAKTLNFTYTVEIIKHQNDRNSSNEKNKLTNMFDLATYIIPDAIKEMIRSKSIAMAACGFTIIDQNKFFVNYTVPISTQPYTFIVARPKELSRALLFMSPFSKDTWLCLAIAIIIMGPILYHIHRYSPVYDYKGISMKGGLSSIHNCMWYMYGALLQQGGMHLPYADSARLLVGAWWLVVLVVATTYCGNLVAFLTFPKIDTPITSIDELLEHRDTMTWSLVKGDYLENQLKITREPKFINLYHGIIPMERNSEMIEKIKEGKHVFIDWRIRLQYIMKQNYLETDRCNFALGMEDFFDEKIALIVAQDTPYLSTINEEITRLHQVGLIQKWLKNYLPKKDRCWKVRHVAEVNNHTVNMDDMQGSFFVLFFGFFLSLLLILMEKLWHKHSLRRGKKVIQPFVS